MPGCRAGLTADEKEQPAEVACSVDQWFSNRVPWTLVKNAHSRTLSQNY